MTKHFGKILAMVMVFAMVVSMFCMGVSANTSDVANDSIVATADEATVDEATADETTKDEASKDEATKDEPATDATTDENVIGILGDANTSGKVDIRDVTEIQKYLAVLATLDEAEVILADADMSGKVNIKDATEIQKWLVDLPANDKIGTTVTADDFNTATPDEEPVTTPDEKPVTTPDEEEATTDEPVATPDGPGTTPDEATKDEVTTPDEPVVDDPIVEPETETITFVDGTPEAWIGGYGAQIYLYDYATETAYLGTAVDATTWTFEVPVGLTTINFYRCENEFSTSAWNSWTTTVSVRDAETMNTYTASADGVGLWNGEIPAVAYYLRGSMNGWGVDNPMTYNEDGTWTAEIALAAGTFEYKVATADWTTSYPGGGNATLTVEADATYLFTLNTDNTVTATVVVG